jgi:di/tripeptidase
MSFVSFPTDPNIMNDSELLQLKENYANMIIDGMDMDSLCQMAFDMLMDAYKDCTEEDIKEEVLDLYDEELLESLMPVE